MTLIVQGVLPGSKGPLFYPLDEISRNYMEWDNIQLMLDHPTLNGYPVGAKQYPQVWNSHGLGFIKKPVVKSNKLMAEGWFDIERCNKLDKRIVQNLLTNKPIELSTGLYTTNKQACPAANYRGRYYSHIATNYKPDHVAVLVDKVGACSLKDGCGVLVNTKTEPTVNQRALQILIDNGFNPGQPRDNRGRWSAGGGGASGGKGSSKAHGSAQKGFGGGSQEPKSTTREKPPEVPAKIHSTLAAAGWEESGSGDNFTSYQPGNNGELKAYVYDKTGAWEIHDLGKQKNDNPESAQARGKGHTSLGHAIASGRNAGDAAVAAGAKTAAKFNDDDENPSASLTKAIADSGKGKELTHGLDLSGKTPSSVTGKHEKYVTPKSADLNAQAKAIVEKKGKNPLSSNAEANKAERKANKLFLEQGAHSEEYKIAQKDYIFKRAAADREIQNKIPKSKVTPWRNED
jgi:hypothetical protein